MGNQDLGETETHRVVAVEAAQGIGVSRQIVVAKKPTTEKQSQNLKMAYIRDIVATELALSNPSLKLDSLLHDRRLARLVSLFKSPTHPAYALMIRRAIEVLNEEGGSCEKAIAEFIVKEYDNLPLAHEAILKHHLRKLCEEHELLLKGNERYIIVNNDAVGKQGKESKSFQKKGRPRKGDGKGGEERNGRDLGEGNRLTNFEIEGIREERKGGEGREEVACRLGKGMEENFNVVKERSEEEETAATEAQPNKEHNEENESVEAQKLVIISEPNKPQHQQTEVIKEQLQFEEAKKHHQQDTAKLNKIIPTAATVPSAVPIEWRKLRSHTRDNLGLACKRTRDMEKNSDAMLPLLIHQHQNEPSPKRCCRANVGPVKPASDGKQKLQGEKEFSLLQQSSNRWERRVLRSHLKESSIADSASPTLTLPCVPSKRQEKHKVEGKRRGRPPKPKPDMGLNAEAALSSAALQPVKQRGRGRPRKARPNAETAIVVFKPSKGRGRPPKEKETEVVTMASFSNRVLRKMLTPKPERGASRSPGLPRKIGRGRPPKQR